MDFEFKLPDGWLYDKHPNGESYRFWRQDDPTHTFSLTTIALQVYGDNPVQLGKIISMQMEVLEASRNARTAPNGRKDLVAPGVELCTTPHYCKWAAEHNRANNYQDPINTPCYCKAPDHLPSQLLENKQRERNHGDWY